MSDPQTHPDSNSPIAWNFDPKPAVGSGVVLLLRLLASLNDGLLLCIGVVIAAFGGLRADALGWSLIAIMICLWLLGESLCSNSPGKWLAGLRLELPSPQPLRLARLVLRNLLKWAPLALIYWLAEKHNIRGEPLLLGYLLLIAGPLWLDASRRSLPDRLSGSRVIAPEALKTRHWLLSLAVVICLALLFLFLFGLLLSIVLAGLGEALGELFRGLLSLFGG
ncbi:MAG: hypothetical protein CVV27_12595 [Candidatus Melainabacteria bacterium HGW-Melainabacteria-1]|nr:MAG: hypothetical protein CVV27_12595 [Candidatus Melainabacteria bacterium HGW-Melainabacteria-1]